MSEKSVRLFADGYIHALYDMTRTICYSANLKDTIYRKLLLLVVFVVVGCCYYDRDYVYMEILCCLE
jgi:hypothetical protein